MSTHDPNARVVVMQIPGVFKHSEDPAKHDMELHCSTCGQALCDVQDGDDAWILVLTALDHTCKIEE
jgi:hypothetical protein